MKEYMTGHQYEHQCVKMLKNRGFSNVKVTQGSNDHGIDVLATYKDKKYAIQCKYYSNTVGNSAVQEAYTGCAFYKYDVPVVLTNSTFTKSATIEAESIGVLLWDRNRIPIGHYSMDFSAYAANQPSSIGCIILLVLFAVFWIKNWGVYSKSLGIFPFALLIIFIIILVVLEISRFKFKSSSRNTLPKDENKHQLSDEEVLNYARKCEKYMQEQDYMESLGIKTDNDNK